MALSLGFPLALLLALVTVLVADHTHTAEARETFAVREGVARLRGDDALISSLRRGLRFPMLKDSEQPFRSAYNGKDYTYETKMARRSGGASRGRRQRQLLTSRTEALPVLSRDSFYPDLRRGMRFPIVDPAQQ